MCKYFSLCSGLIFNPGVNNPSMNKSATPKFYQGETLIHKTLMSEKYQIKAYHAENHKG